MDTKLARHAKPTALLQLACYADALVRLGRPVPRQVHLWLGDGRRQAVPTADVLPLAREYRERVLAELRQEPAAPLPLWGDARPACATCRWGTHCADGRREARDLSLVAGMRRDQTARLRSGGILTIEALACAGDELRPASIGKDTWIRLRAQSTLQVAGAGASPPLHEVFDAAALALLPAPDPGDLYYDIEGDPFAEHGAGLEYLHGMVDAAEEFSAFWAHDRAAEKRAFEQVVDAFTAAARAHPGMHVYHYAPYEHTALTTLAARHATREEEVDQLLRDGRLVDLYAVVRRAGRVSTESYSIKKLEPLYMGEQLRDGEVTTAGDSIVEHEQAMLHQQAGRRDRADALLEAIRDYNEYDCVSTHRLHHWLLDLRTTGPTTPGAPEPVERELPATELLAEHLRALVPATDRTGAQQATALLAAALGYHRRNQKTFWWEHFDRLRRPLPELMDDDAVVVLEHPSAGEWAKVPPKRTSPAPSPQPPARPARMSAPSASSPSSCTGARARAPRTQRRLRPRHPYGRHRRRRRRRNGDAGRARTHRQRRLVAATASTRPGRSTVRRTTGDGALRAGRAAAGRRWPGHRMVPPAHRRGAAHRTARHRRPHRGHHRRCRGTP